MYCITDEQVDYILNDIRRNGIEMEDLQLNLLDHICCKVEQEFKEGDDFERFYKQAVKQLCSNNLREIEVETINLLTFKNYYVMKKAMMISGGIAAVTFIAGCLFKLMHWPGASALIFLAIVLMGLVFLPIAILLKGKEEGNTALDRVVLVTGAIAGILYSSATLFTVMHWPGSSALWFATTGTAMLVFIPLYFYAGTRKPEKKINTVFTSVLLVGATGLIFTMLRVRQPEPVPMYSYIKNEQLLKNMQRNAIANNPLAAEINNTCDQIKAYVLQQEIGMVSIPADFEEKHIVINERNMGNLLKVGKGAMLLDKLKVGISNYNASANEENKIPVSHSLLDVAHDKLDLYTNVSVLNSMTQLQMFVAVSGQVKETGATAAVK